MPIQRTIPSALVLTVFVSAIAYVRSARLKSLIYSMPVPFSCAYLATRLPVDATYVTGLILVTAYNWVVYGLHIRLRVPLLLAIAISAGGYFAAGMFLRPLASVPIWWIAAIALGGWLANFLLYHPQEHPGYRSHAAWWVKAPVIFAIAMMIYSATQLLAGAVGTFPYAGVFTSYEMRHSLRMLAGQFAINAMGILLCMIVIALSEPHLPTPWPLALGWLPVIAWTGVVHYLRLGRAEAAIAE